MLNYEDAFNVARNAAKKHHEPHGVFEITNAVQKHRGEDPQPTVNPNRYFSRKLDGLPPKDARLVAQAWPNGTSKEEGQ